MRSTVAGNMWTRLSPRRVFAMVATFTLHLLLIGWLIRETQVQAPSFTREAIEIELRDFETPAQPLPPPRPPGALPPPVPELRAVPRPQAPSIDTEVAVEELAEPSEEPAPTDLRARIEHQRREVAADIARENAPERRAFAGRSIDAMLPDKENVKLPTFRPKTHDGMRDTLRRLGNMISIGVPSAATEYDSPTDLLTEGWENRHHSSDMADCDREYAQFDAELRRQLCGYVKPPG